MSVLAGKGGFLAALYFAQSVHGGKGLLLNRMAGLPYAMAIADKGVEKALLDDPHLRRGLTTYRGMLTLEETAANHHMTYTDPRDALLK